jgi:transposase
MLTDAQWAMLEPLVEQCRPRAKPHRTICVARWRRSSGAIENGAKWRSVPVELGPWWRAARPSSLGSPGVSGSVC